MEIITRHRGNHTEHIVKRSIAEKLEDKIRGEKVETVEIVKPGLDERSSTMVYGGNNKVDNKPQYLFIARGHKGRGNSGDIQTYFAQGEDMLNGRIPVTWRRDLTDSGSKEYKTYDGLLKAAGL